jgi:hypothetical protein
VASVAGILARWEQTKVLPEPQQWPRQAIDL